MNTTHAAVLLLSLLSVFTTWLGVMLAVWLRENAFVSLHERVPMARRYRNMRMFAAGMFLSVLVYGQLARITEAG